MAKHLHAPVPKVGREEGVTNACDPAPPSHATVEVPAARGMAGFFVSATLLGRVKGKYKIIFSVFLVLKKGFFNSVV